MSLKSTTSIRSVAETVAFLLSMQIALEIFIKECYKKTLIRQSTIHSSQTGFYFA
jgi:hypothetical protein